MAYKEGEDFSLILTRFFMKFVGFWKYENRREEIILNLRLTYTVAAIIFAISVEAVDLYYCWGDFNAVTYNACATMSLVLVLVKLFTFIIRRDDVVDLINFSEDNFWKMDYNDFGKEIMRGCEKKGVLFLSTYTFFAAGTIFNYLLAPILESIGKDEIDRVLPFKLWLDLPLTISPYYEITFTIQALSTIHTGVCFLCFDNLLCIFTIQVVGQFKILQYRLENLCKKCSQMMIYMNNNIQETNNDKLVLEIYREFKFCVDQHRTLINYIKALESIFTFILLGQMLVSSFLMCLIGFQAFLATTTIVRRLIFISNVLACISQLLLFTWTCNEIIIESTNVGDALYRSEWYSLPHHGMGIPFKQGMLIVMARVRHPCFLSAGKFCPMSLQAFTGILGTAMSYFTVLRQMSTEIEN